MALPKTTTVRGDAEVLEAPELAGAVEAHLDFVVHEHDLALVEDLLEALVIASGGTT